MLRRIIYLVVILSLMFASFLVGRRSAAFSNYIQARDASGNPDEFDKNFAAMTEWIKNYKQQHPGATDAEVNDAYQKALEYAQKVSQ